ncbi:MAG TPA: heavy metal sensor histidine kinase, partial [Gemmataceae bacterium]|nr:heavy metal sensor histidine kinase [Gemmataceae bacterium]
TRAWSLAARLTAWYAGSAFALVLGATGFLYWALVANLDRKDNQLLADRVSELQWVMLNQPGDTAALRDKVGSEWDSQQRIRIHMRVMDERGQVLAETPGMSTLLPSALFPPPAQESSKGTSVDTSAGAPFRVLAVATEGGKGSRHVIQVAMDRSLEIELHVDYRDNLLLALGTTLLVCILVGYHIARRGMQPIHAVAQTASRIRPTNLGERIATGGLPGELLTLANTFNQMLDRLEQSFVRLSRFSADIAHELRTPVYSLRGEAEVALSRPRSPEEYREVLTSNLEECGRLARLIDRMLFLARAENPEMQITREPCDVGSELTTVREFYQVAATDAGVHLAVVAQQKVNVHLDRGLFQRAVGNLVANALAHTARGGTVTLSVTEEGTASRIEVADTGCGIPPEHLPFVFERFHRADPTRCSKNGSVGLGLAIVKSIVELHGGTVVIASEVGRGTRASILIPKRKVE